MKTFRLLGLRRLRQQPLRAGIAVVAVGAGVALAVAILVTTSSIDRSLVDFGRSLAGPAELRIVGASNRGGLALDAVDRAAAVEGVDAVVPMVQAVAIVDDLGSGNSEQVLVLGVDCRAESLVGAFGCDQAALDAAGDVPLLVSPLVVAGGADSLRTDTGRVDVSNVAVSDDLAGLGVGRVVVFSLSGAQQRFTRPAGVDVAYVVPAAGTDLVALRARLEGAVGEHNGVLTSDDPPPVVAASMAAFLPLFTMLGLFGLGTGAVLVRNTVTLSLAERRRQLAILGALGARGRTVVGGAAGEAALLGAVGGVLGTAGGVALAGPIVGSLSQFTESLLGVPLERHVTGGSVLVGAVLGTVVGALAALGPARRALRLDVAGELSGRRASEDAAPVRVRRRVVLATLFVAVGIGGCIASSVDGALQPWQAAMAPISFLLASLGTLVFASAVAPVLVRRFARLTRGTRRGTLVLAVANLVREPRRTGILAVAIASPVIIGFVTDGFVESVRTNIIREFGEDGDFVSISTIEPNEGNDAFLSPDVVAAIGALPQVRRIDTGAFLVTGSQRGELIGVGGYSEAPDEFEPLDGSYDAARFEAGEVLIGPALARETGARGGDTIELETPTGVVEVPVLAVIADGDFGGRGVDMAYSRMVELYGAVSPAFLSIKPADGVSEAELSAAIRGAVGTLEPELRVRTSDEIARDVADTIGSQMVPFRVLQRGLLFVAFVAVLSNLLLVGMQRRRETGLLAAIGAAPPELRRVVLAEAGTVGGVAVVQSAFIGPLMLWATILIIPAIVGYRDPYRPEWSSVLVGGGVAVVIALLASAWPAWRASRVEVLDALRYE